MGGVSQYYKGSVKKHFKTHIYLNWFNGVVRLLSFSFNLFTECGMWILETAWMNGGSVAKGLVRRGGKH